MSTSEMGQAEEYDHAVPNECGPSVRKASAVVAISSDAGATGLDRRTLQATNFNGVTMFSIS